MKHILITGAGSYIGTSFEAYIKETCKDCYTVDTVDMIDGAWRTKDFSGYDSVFHVAGIAHQKETKENAHLYYEINRDLAIETAKKAKADGAKQFIFLSSMSVYGCDEGIITKDTEPRPVSNYGISKLEAEKAIGALADQSFKVCTVRPPMVYGNGCKGNFNTVLKLVRKLPFFPRIQNRRSMIYIDNLSSFIKLVIDRQAEGLFLPQNREYTQTSHMAKVIALALEKRIFISRLLGLGVILLKPFAKIAKKAFGSLIYQDTEDFDFSYCVVDNDESYKLSVSKKGA